MPPTEQEDWQDYLGPGEHLVWTGAPLPDKRIRLSDVGMMLFSLPFLLFGLGALAALVYGLISGQINTPSNALLAVLLFVFGIIFTVVGGVAGFGSWLHGRFAHRFVRYALSNRRAYVATTWWGRELQSYPIRPDALLEIHHDRLDTVRLHIRTETDSDGDVQQIKLDFIGQPDGMALYRLIQRLQADQTA